MRIRNLQVRRYRAFDQKVSVPLDDLTVLTGPNNLGKSTLLNALDLFFGVFRPRRLARIGSNQRYNYEEDYPKKYEGRPGRRWTTLIRVGVELSSNDIDEIRSDNIPEPPSKFDVAVEFQYDDRYRAFRPQIDIPSIDQSLHAELIAWFRDNVRYVYIPATRNVGEFRRTIFSELVAGAVARISRSKQRIEAIERFYSDVLDEVSSLEADLADELRPFLPSIQELHFSVDELDLSRLISVRDIEVDDGARTLLSQKGDGFKSLFAISLLQFISKQRYGRNLFLGIEEPEAHLHSSAVYEIKSTIRELSESYQVIITTHSPILIQRDDLRSNILIEEAEGEGFSSNARPAKNLTDIRRSLGIRPHENMTTAEIVVVVEGTTEERVFPSVLARELPELEEPLAMGRIRVLSANSASNVPVIVRALARDAATCLVFLDSDEAGRTAITKIQNSGLLQPIDIFRVPDRDGCKETEFEDIFDPSLYITAVSEAIGLNISEEDFIRQRQRSGGRDNRMKKWSDVMAQCSNVQGRDWGSVEGDAKDAFATSVISNVSAMPGTQLNWVKGLAEQIARYLREPTDAA